MTEPPDLTEHAYTGDPKHCHACAIRAFVRTRAAERERDALRAERDTLCGAIAAQDDRQRAAGVAEAVGII